MTDQIDPYAELEVENNVTAEQAKRAYKKKAKRVHPDKGGDAAAFKRLGTALAIVVDPKKRAEYDATGKVEEEKLAELQAAEKVAAEVGKILQEFIATGFRDPTKDVKHRHVIKDATAAVRKEMAEKVALIAVGKRIDESLVDMKERLSGGPPLHDTIRASINVELNNNRMNAKHLEREIEVCKMAIKILVQYEYRVDDFMQGFATGFRPYGHSPFGGFGGAT